MKKIFILIIVVLLFSGCESNHVKEKINVVKSITCNEVKESTSVVIIDVRTKEEYDEYHLDNAINIPVDLIGSIVNHDEIKKDSKIIVYCKSGARSKKAADTLINMGYTDINDLGSISKCN